MKYSMIASVRWQWLGVLASAGLLCTGTPHAQSVAPSAIKKGLTIGGALDARNVPKMNVEDARNIVEHEWSQNNLSVSFGWGAEESAVAGVHVSSSSVSISTNHYDGSAGGVSPCRLTDLGTIDTGGGWPGMRYIRFSCLGRPSKLFFQFSRDAVNRIADALSVLKQAAPSRLPPDQDSAFQAVVAEYRAATAKPQLPEEARKFKVQAEDAINEKQFEEAAAAYAKALGVAPWWPEGHFNRALVFSDIRDFAGAVDEMQRYLALVPDAPDARAAQDKIYAWQRKL